MTDPVYAAIGGVIVGALASGSVQSYLGRADRRRDGRAAARLLYMQLHDAENAISDLRKRRDWEMMITDWTVYGAAWDKYADRVTHVLSTPRFALVDSAFWMIASIARSRERDAKQPAPPQGQPPVFNPPDDRLAGYRATAEAAKNVLLGASFSRWEWRARKKALRPL